MTITLLSQAPDFSDLTVRYTGQNMGLKVSPPLAGVPDALQGTLYVCESMLYFYSNNVNSGIAVEYPDIIIHAISRQDSQPSIYCQLDAGLFFPSQQFPDDQGRSAVAYSLSLSFFELPLVEDIYLALSDCAALHPDLEDEEEDDQQYFIDPSDPGELSEMQQAALQHLESVFEQPAPPQQNGHAGQFDDAE
ncbi:hypothetical protein DM01DRAFT_317987 [Hesseltinella vesiculosa]|uniref:Regulator of volume decrease after cellular swelling-domain-containing protein n=1 Tax=Hesseltinella vesiculosa TaxID=101127 RepID=A0A1X2GTY0_9FUNG|nr:hypothetical protein DM01DRAFT_317987 [Hesseltinella vesiculosa]